MNAEVEGKTRAETLSLLLRQGQASAAKLATCTGISVQAMRRHLRSMEDQGLVQASSSADGPGRPVNLWQLTSQGYDVFNNMNGIGQFAVDLLASIESKYSSESIKEVLYSQMLEKAIVYRNKIGTGPLSLRLKRLNQLRNEEGYLTELNTSKDGSIWYLNAFHCSIRSIAEVYPVICDQELELIRYVFPDCEVKRVQWSLESGHSCGFQITPTFYK